MKKVLTIIAIIAIFIISGSILYYYVIYRPRLDEEEFTFQKLKYESEQREKQNSKQALKRCLREVDDWYSKMSYSIIADDISMTNEDTALLWKIYQDKKDDCYELYDE